MATVSIIISTYNRADLLRQCLTSIFETSDMRETEIIVVENGSRDNGATIAMMQREFSHVRLLVQAENVGFCAANNLGVAASSAPYVMLLNSDAVLLSDTVGSLVRFLQEHPDVSCVGPRIVLPNGARQPRVFGNLPSLWRIAMQSLYIGQLFTRIPILEGVDGLDRSELTRDVGWISGVCMVIRRSDYLAAGGFDPSFYMYCEDMDLCSRLKAYGRIVHLDDHPVLHYGGGVASSIEGQLRNSLLQQRNLMKIVGNRSGPAVTHAASLLISFGLLLRILAGLALIPRRGLKGNIVLRSSWLRFSDLIRPVSMPLTVAQLAAATAARPAGHRD